MLHLVIGWLSMHSLLYTSQGQLRSHHHHHYSACTISAQLRLLPTQSPQWLIQSQFDSILQGKVVQRQVVLQSGHPGGVGSPSWPSPQSNHSGEQQSEFFWHRLTHPFRPAEVWFEKNFGCILCWSLYTINLLPMLVVSCHDLLRDDYILFVSQYWNLMHRICLAELSIDQLLCHFAKQ